MEPPSIEGRVPPHDLDAEAAVLSAVMLDGTALDKVLEFLKPEHFYSEAHRRIFEAALELRGRGQPVDVVQVATWLKDRERIQQIGGMEYLAAILNQAPAIANIAAYGRTIHEKWRVRQLILTCQRVAAEGYIDYGVAQEFIDNAEQSIYTIARTQESSSVERLLEVIKKSFKKLTEALERGDRITGIATGFERLDRLTAGLHDGDLTIVAARPGMGKTSLVLNMAVNVATSKPTQMDSSGAESARRWDEQGVGVVVFSLEMPREQIANRMVCCEGRVDVSKVRSGYLGPQEWNKLTQASAFLGSLPVWVDDSPALSILELRAKVRRLQAEFDKLDEQGRKVRRIGVVVVDYLQLMRGRENASSREQEISEISRGLKAMAKELSIAVIALSQLNRAVETRSDKSKRPQLSDLRECVAGDTLVCLADGRRVPIRDLVGQTPEVLAVSNGRITAATSEKVWRVGKRPVFDVSLASGRTIRATARHRLLVGRSWKRVDALRPGSRVALARRHPEPEVCEHWSEHRIALLGLFIGDGSYLKHQPLRITTASDEISELVTRAATEEFGSRVSRHEGKGNWHQLVISGNGDRRHPRGFGKWLKDLGIFGQRSHEKRVPASAFRLHDEQIGLLLRHLWATDGTIHVRKPSSRGASTVSFATCSHGLASDVAALLLRLGIVARVRRVEQGSHRPLFHVVVSGGDAQRAFLERVGAFGPRVRPALALATALHSKASNTNVDTLPVEVFERVRQRMTEQHITTRAMARKRGTAYGGSSHFRFAPSREMAAEYAEILQDPELMADATSDLFWDRVVSIVPAGLEEVFDLTVPGPSCWLADGIVSHNSGAIEQDADNIVFIYRDEYYNKDTTTERNIAELIVAKQRNGPTGTVKVRFDREYTRFDNLAEGEYPDDEMGDGM